MSKIKTITVNAKGMITIPVNIRNKYNIKEGTEVLLLEIDGNITIIPIVDVESLRVTSCHELAKNFDEIHANELELEK